jgi:hypothetical protein
MANDPGGIWYNIDYESFPDQPESFFFNKIMR